MGSPVPHGAEHESDEEATQHIDGLAEDLARGGVVAAQSMEEVAQNMVGPDAWDESGPTQVVGFDDLGGAGSSVSSGVRDNIHGLLNAGAISPVEPVDDQVSEPTLAQDGTSHKPEKADSSHAAALIALKGTSDTGVEESGISSARIASLDQTASLNEAAFTEVLRSLDAHIARVDACLTVEDYSRISPNQLPQEFREEYKRYQFLGKPNWIKADMRTALGALQQERAYLLKARARFLASQTPEHSSRFPRILKAWNWIVSRFKGKP